MTIQQIENKVAQIYALATWVQKEIQKAMSEIKAAREAEEALLEASYQAACEAEAEAYAALDAYFQDEQDLSEKYTQHVFAQGGAL